jgi:hypothetical protein
MKLKEKLIMEELLWILKNKEKIYIIMILIVLILMLWKIIKYQLDLLKIIANNKLFNVINNLMLIKLYLIIYMKLN